MKRVYFVESSVMGPAAIREAARTLDLQVTFLSKITNQEGDALRQLLSGRLLQCDTENHRTIEALIAMDTQRGDLAGVMTLLDSRLNVVAKVCASLSVGGVDPAVACLKSKANINVLVPEYVPQSIHIDVQADPYSKLADWMDQIEAETKAHGFVVKPSFAAGAKGLRLLPPDADVGDMTQLMDAYLPAMLKPYDLVVQVCMPGELVSLEGFVANGQVTYLGVTGRRKIGHTEALFIFPYDREIDPHALARAQKAVVALVQRAAFNNGFFHSEFIVCDRDAWLIDANFGRPGGANIAEILSLAYGLTLPDFYRLVIAISLYGAVPQDIRNRLDRPLPQEIWGAAYGLPDHSCLLDIQGLDCLRSRHTLAQNFGAMIDPMGSSNWAWVGLLAGTKDAVVSDLKQLRLHTSQGLVRPVCLMAS